MATNKMDEVMARFDKEFPIINGLLIRNDDPISDHYNYCGSAIKQFLKDTIQDVVEDLTIHLQKNYKCGYNMAIDDIMKKAKDNWNIEIN